MPYFEVTELGLADYAAAWPLVRSQRPDVTLQQWQLFAGSLAGRGGGIIGVAAEGGRFLGVASYEPAVAPNAGKVLRVETLAAFELSRRAPVRAVLCDALDRLASLHGCDAVAVTVPSQSFMAQAQRRAQTISGPDPQVDRVSMPKKLNSANDSDLPIG